MTIDLTYFYNIHPIWLAYEKGKIGLETRDQLLKPYRDELYQVKVNDPHAHPTRNIAQPPTKPRHDDLAQLTADWYGVPVEEIE